jgi:hypothetical protein
MPSTRASATGRVARAATDRSRASTPRGVKTLKVRLARATKFRDENSIPVRDRLGDGAKTTKSAAKDLRRTIERATTTGDARTRAKGDVGPGDLRRRLPRRDDGAAANAKAKATRTSGDLRNALSGKSGRKGVANAKGRGDARVNALLRRLNLSSYEAAFAREEIDLIALRAMRDGDFDKLGLPYGVKVKLALALGRR